MKMKTQESKETSLILCYLVLRALYLRFHIKSKGLNKWVQPAFVEALLDAWWCSICFLFIDLQFSIQISNAGLESQARVYSD